MINQILKELEQLPQAQYWNVSPPVGKFLAAIVAELGSQTVMEIGTSNGYSALWFCQSLSHSYGHLWTIESHAERFQEAAANFQKAGVSSMISQIKGHAPEIIKTIPALPLLDFVFLDATKAEYSEHLTEVLSHLAPHGVILADNIQSHWQQLGESGFFKIINSLSRFNIYLSKDFGTGMILLAPQNLPVNLEVLLPKLTAKKWNLGLIDY